MRNDPETEILNGKILQLAEKFVDVVDRYASDEKLKSKVSCDVYYSTNGYSCGKPDSITLWIRDTTDTPEDSYLQLEVSRYTSYVPCVLSEPPVELECWVFEFRRGVPNHNGKGKTVVTELMSEQINTDDNYVYGKTQELINRMLSGVCKRVYEAMRETEAYDNPSQTKSDIKEIDEVITKL